MKILITGAGGYIGSALSHFFTKLGHKVYALTSPNKGSLYIPQDAEFHTLNLCNSDALKEYVKRCNPDAIIHAAAYSDRKESLRDTSKYSRNITGTVNLMDAAVISGCTIIVNLSSITVYAGCAGGVVTERTQPNPKCYYAETKYLCDRIVSWYGKQNGMTVTTLRLTNVIGNYCGYKDKTPKNLIQTILKNLSVGDRSFIVYNGYKTPDKTIIRDYVDVTDVCNAVNEALYCKGGLFLIGSGQGYSVREIVRLIQIHAGKLLISEKKISGCAWIPDNRVADITKAKNKIWYAPKIELYKSIADMYELIVVK